MRLTYMCSACKKQNYLKIKAETRPDLQMKLNLEELNVNCSNCGKLEKKHLNQIIAAVDNRLILVGVLIGLVATAIFWNSYGAISTASFGIAFLFWVAENKAINGFNKYVIRRK